MRPNLRFTTRHLLLWLSVYAVLLGVIAGLPLPRVQVVAAIAVVTVFVIVDALSARDRGEVPALPRCSIVVAHYVSAFAAAVGICFALYQIVPEPPPTPQPPLSFLEFVFHFASGQVFVEIGQAIGEAIAIAVTYLLIFAAFSTIAFSSSLFALRHFRSAKWYALVNSPGTCLFIFFVVAELVDSATG